MKKQILSIALLSILSLTSCYDFNRRQNELDAESKGKATLLEAESSKKAKIEDAKADLESSKLEAERKIVEAESNRKATLINAKAKAEQISIIGKSLRENPEYNKYLMIDAMYNHGKTIYIPTEAGLPIIERK